ncbi:MAG TPA: S-layer homology domain-containing protein [Thermoanaerobaculia bacterium]|nr:S-layer homology domain-containing protein [Thermoanaerobaculia bacterium]
MRRLFGRRLWIGTSSALLASVLSGAASAILGLCGPFTDVSDASFCPFVLEILTLGITTGTTATTYDPTSSVTRLQMAAFLSRTVDGALLRGGRRAAMNRFWTPKSIVLGLTTVGASPNNVRSDGSDLWVASRSGTVSRVHASDGRLLDTWTGAGAANDAVLALGQVFVNSYSTPGNLYSIDPTQPAGVVTTLATNLGGSSDGITFDGTRIWTANQASSVSIVTNTGVPPWTVTTVTAGFQVPTGILTDGSNIWVTDYGAGTLLKLASSAAILSTVTLGGGPAFPAYDGANIWVPRNGAVSVAVVRASSGAVLATLTGNGLSLPNSAAFDGERILVTNYTGNHVSLWKAADLTPLGSIATGAGTYPVGACSDGVSFWVTFLGSSQLARF